MSIFSGPDIITDGLVLYLDAANSRSYPGTGTSCKSLVGAPIGTLSGVTYDSENSGSFVFDTGTDRIETSSQTSVVSWDSVYSFSAWIYLIGSGNNQTVFRSTPNSSNRNSFTVSPNWISLRTYNGTVYKSAISTSVINLANRWSFVTGVQVSGDSRQLYLNGVLLTHTTSGGDSLCGTTTDNSFFIGTNVECNNQFNLIGNLSIAMLYNRALTATEVKQNYLATKGRYGL